MGFMSAADAIRSVLSPVLAGWEFQFGALEASDSATQYAAIQPNGGALAEVVRRPQLTLSLVSSVGQSRTAVASLADQTVEAMRESSGSVVLLQPGEPVFMPTSDGRIVFQIAISAIVE